ncbi:protein FAM3D [Alligator mississippiensis]|uniref:protein FAM3D n=1 Tax=Alligator mississippiensis TaxID=8496 RepID=UPI002877BE0A|nr:protein FAM3D [Alligator mississippiensis]
MRPTGARRVVGSLFMLAGTWFLLQTELNTSWKSVAEQSLFESQELLHKCGNVQSCPPNHFAFKIVGGTRKGVQPFMCFDDVIVMSVMRNNVNYGLNFALVNGTTGHLIKTTYFNMWSGDVKHLVDFLKTIQDGTLVLIASYDDPATKMNNEARTLLTNLGSSYAAKLRYWDNWVFLGEKGRKDKRRFEKLMRIDEETDKELKLPVALRMEGCVPQK